MTTTPNERVIRVGIALALSTGAALATTDGGAAAGGAGLTLAPPGALTAPASPELEVDLDLDPAAIRAVGHAALGHDARPFIAGRAIGTGPRQHPDWSRPAAQVPTDLIDAVHPTHYVYDGRPVVIPVDGARIAVQMRDEHGDALGAANGIGVTAFESRALGFERWRVLELTEVARNATAVDEHLRTLRDHPEVEFTSPVFVNPMVEDGWLSVTRDIIVRVQPHLLGDADAIIAHAALELEIVERDFGGLPGAYRLRSHGGDGFAVLRKANALALDGRFAWSEPEMIGTMELHVLPTDPGFDNSWALNNTGQQGCCPDIDLDAPEAWDIANGDWTVRVLVLDTGIEQDHPDLNLIEGRDFTNGLPDGFGIGNPVGPCDDHGTSVAGCIAARLNNGEGTVGIAPDSRVISARIGGQVWSPCGSTFATYSSTYVVNALDWAYGEGIQITNASFGVTSSSAVRDAYDDTWFNGMLHFASAGNGGADSIGDPALTFPASVSTVQGVAALDPDGSLTSFSNSGPGLAFAAPGISIYTTDRTGSPGYSSGNNTWAMGTSFASPFVAGAAALIWSAFPEYSSTVIEFWLQTGATDLGVSGYDTTFGWGLPNPRASLNGPGPFNNFCANPWPILTPVFQPLPFDTMQATAFDDEPQEWCEWNNAGVSNSVWFAFYAPCDGVVDIDTGGSDYDTVASLWVGSCTTAWPVACDDDSGSGFTSQLTGVPVSKGNIYMIKVSDYNAAPGGGMLDLAFEFRQPNESCADAIEITAGTTPFCTLGAAADFLPPSCTELDNSIVGDVWFTHVATEDGNLTVTACGLNDFDTKLAVYRESGGYWCPFIVNGAQLLGCSDDGAGACTAVSSRVTVPVDEGHRYTIRVGGQEGPAGDGLLTLSYGTCEADLDGDGSVAFEDLVILLGAWGTANPVADISGDGSVGMSDLVVVLGAWGSC